MSLFGGGSAGYGGPPDNPYAWVLAAVTLVVIFGVVLLLSWRSRRRRR